MIAGGLSVLAFTDWIGGPFGWAEVLLYTFLIIVGLILISAFILYRSIKKRVAKLQSDIKDKVGSTFATPVKAVDITEDKSTASKTANTTARLRK